jgi:hypothetical protein
VNQHFDKCDLDYHDIYLSKFIVYIQFLLAKKCLYVEETKTLSRFSLG